MKVILEEIIIYGFVLMMTSIIVYYYLKNKKKRSIEIKKKVAQAKEDGLFEPISLHPYIDLSTCIGSAACVADCPEKDILGIVDDVATVINASNCVGHGACFHACPVEAISLRIGTESRGVELPHVSENFESNIKGIYIAGELGGMGLIKNSVDQGQQAMEYLVKSKKPSAKNILDVIIIGAGPAGISATLTAKKLNLNYLTLEQDSLGGTVYTFPRSKIVMTAPMDLPLYGKVKLFDTSKHELLTIWNDVLSKNQINIQEHVKVEQIIPQPNESFKVITSDHQEHFCNQVLLAIGRRGSPRKLNIPGENLPKVAYRLLEPERIRDKKIIVVGGGDSAVEAAMLLMEENEVILSYRKEKFSRIKPKNRARIEESIHDQTLAVLFNSNLISIEADSIKIQMDNSGPVHQFENDLVYIFAGGELPTAFLKKAGIEITKRYGHILKKH